MSVLLDLQGAVDKLVKELGIIRFSRQIEPEKLSRGDPSSFLAILQYLCTNFSKSITHYLAAKGHELFGKPIHQFIESVITALRQDFGYTSKITKEQLFTTGSAELKLEFILDVIRLFKKKHNLLQQTKSTTRTDGVGSKSTARIPTQDENSQELNFSKYKRPREPSYPSIDTTNGTSPSAWYVEVGKESTRPSIRTSTLRLNQNHSLSKSLLDDLDYLLETKAAALSPLTPTDGAALIDFKHEASPPKAPSQYVSPTRVPDSRASDQLFESLLASNEAIAKDLGKFMARFDQFEETVGAVLDNIMTQLITMDSRLKKLENGVERKRVLLPSSPGMKSGTSSFSRRNLDNDFSRSVDSDLIDTLAAKYRKSHGLSTP